MPRTFEIEQGFETEDGPRPEFAIMFGSVELEGGYRERTHANAKKSDATVWFGDPSSPGRKTTLRACYALGRPVFIVEDGITCPLALTTWLVAGYVEVLNMARNRESTVTGIGERVERFLLIAFGRLVS